MFTFKDVKNLEQIPKTWPKREPDLLIVHKANDFARCFWIDESLQSNMWYKDSSLGIFEFEKDVYEFEFSKDKIMWRMNNILHHYDDEEDYNMSKKVSDAIFEKTVLQTEIQE